MQTVVDNVSVVHTVASWVGHNKLLLLLLLPLPCVAPSHGTDQTILGMC